RQRRQNAADNDQQRRDRRPPASPAPGWLVRRAARSGPPTGQRLRLAPFTGAEVAVFGSWDAGISGIAHGSPPIIVVHRSRYLWCVCFAKVTMIMMFP